MKKLLIYLTLCTFLFSSCAPTSGIINFKSDERVSAKIKRLNIVAKDRPCKIWLKNGQKYSGKNVIVKIDSTFLEDSTKTKISILTTEISKVEIGEKRRSNLTLKIMMLSGLIAGITTANSDHVKHLPKVEMNFILGFLGLGIGAFVGVLFDSIANSDKTDTYTFSFDEDLESIGVLK